MAVPDSEQVTILSRIDITVSAVSELVDLRLSTVCEIMFSCHLFLLNSADGVSTMYIGSGSSSWSHNCFNVFSVVHPNPNFCVVMDGR